MNLRKFQAILVIKQFWIIFVFFFIAFSGVSSAQTPDLVLLSPQDGDSVVKGAQQDILWAADNVPLVRVELVNGDQVLKRISNAASGESGKLTWTIPIGMQPGDFYKIRLTALNASGRPLNLIAETQGFFSIVDNKRPVILPQPGQNDIILQTPGIEFKFVEFRPKGSVIVKASNISFNDVKINCQIPAKGVEHVADGLQVVGVNNFQMKNSQISDCGGKGIYLKDGSGHVLSSGKVVNTGKDYAIVLDNVNNSVISGWYLRSGMDLRNHSDNNRIFTSLVQGNTAPYPYHISADSEKNQFVRDRERDGMGDVFNENPTNWIHFMVCDNPKGYAGCWSRPGDGPEEDYTPYYSEFVQNVWSVCLPNYSFGNNSCDFENYAQAMAAKNSDGSFRVKPGDVVIIDSAPVRNPVVIGEINRPIWLLGNQWGQKGQYNPSGVYIEKSPGTGPAVDVKASGVKLENLHIDPAPKVLPDTKLISIFLKNSINKYYRID